MLVVVLLWVRWSWGLSHPGSHPLEWLAHWLLLLGAPAAVVIGTAYLVRRARTPRQTRMDLSAGASFDDEALVERDAAGELRAYSNAHGGGAFLGWSHREWVSADAEHAVLVLGPPRSGKTSCVVIPALLACSGAAVSTSTKQEVMAATVSTRSQIGEPWLFDPTGSIDQAGVRRCHWSPVAAASSWDGALLMARAMTGAAPAGRGTQHEQHWSERAAALLAPLLCAANLSGQPVAAVLGWVLRADLDEPGRILEEHDVRMACDVLVGIAKTDGRERSSIFSATAGVLAVYNSDAARQTGRHVNFDADRFVDSQDTLYICAPAHHQAICAPLVVGLLEQIRHAAYRRHQQQRERDGRPVFFCLDELANIAPIPDLQALVSEAGGQGVHVLACLQDQSQARERWGESVADGLLTLFQSKLILTGVSDTRTLEAISTVIGEYDRRLVSITEAANSVPGLISERESGYSQSVTNSTTRQRKLTPGEIAALPLGNGLLVRGAHWGLLQLAPWHSTPAFERATQQPPQCLKARARTLGGDSAPLQAPPAKEPDVPNHARMAVVRAATPGRSAGRRRRIPDVSWWLLYVLTLAPQLISVVARSWLFGLVAYPVCWVLGWPTSQLDKIALVVGFMPLAWSLLALVWPADWLAQQRVGAREPSLREQQTLDHVLGLLAAHDIDLVLPRSFVVLDGPGENAWVLGRQVTIERDLLTSPDLAAVLAHELGHVHAGDGIHTTAINRLAFVPGLLCGHPVGPGVLRGALRALTYTASGELALRLIAPVWGAHWRDQEYLADHYAARLGQGLALAAYLENRALLNDLPVPFAWMTDLSHPPTEERIDRLYAALPPAATVAPALTDMP